MTESDRRTSLSASTLILALILVPTLGALGCATNLLVGADTDGASTGQDEAGDGVLSTTDESGVGTTTIPDPDEGPEDDGTGGTTTGDEGGQTTSDDGTTTDATTSGDTESGMCEAENADTCRAMKGCVWFPEPGVCEPGTPCDGLSLNDCAGQAECLWFGSPGDGACEPGSCGDLETAKNCEASGFCGWFEKTCDSLPCGEIDGFDFCQAHPDCGPAGPDGEEICVPGECLEGECGELANKQCIDDVGCHYLGEVEGTCLPVTCVACSELSEPECNEAPECEYNELKMFCGP